MSSPFTKATQGSRPETRFLDIMPVDKLNKRVFCTLFFSIFATVTGVGIVVPLLPVYAHHSGAGGFTIGLIFGAFSLSRTLFLPYFGRLSDRRGRKPLIVPGLFAYAGISLLFIGFTSVHGLIVIRFLQGVASAALMPVIQAYVGDIAPAGREGGTMGVFNLSMFLGLGLGPLLGGAIRDLWGLQASFAAMGVLAFIGFVLALVWLPPAAEERMVRTAHSPTAWKDLACDRDIICLFLFRFAYTFGIASLWSFLPVLADTQYALSSAAIGSLIMLGVFLSGAVQVPLGALADKADKRAMIALGGVLVSLALWSLEWAQGYMGLAGVNILFGIGGGISMAALMALTVQKGSHTASMGSVMAILTVSHSAGMLAGAVAAGLMMDFLSLRAVFPMGAAIMICCTLIFYCGTRSMPAPPSGSN